MKKIIVYLISLLLFIFTNPSLYSADITEFQIDNAGINESLLNYFSEEEIKKETFFYKTQKNNKDFGHVSIKKKIKGSIYDEIIVAYNSSIGNIGPAKYIDPSYSIGYAVACFQFATVNECNNFIEYINSQIVKFAIKNLKTSIQNAKNTFEKIPKIDLTKSWTDTDLYAHFGLTQEEIDYVKASIK